MHQLLASLPRPNLRSPLHLLAKPPPTTPLGSPIVALPSSPECQLKLRDYLSAITSTPTPSILGYRLLPAGFTPRRSLRLAIKGGAHQNVIGKAQCVAMKNLGLVQDDDSATVADVQCRRTFGPWRRSSTGRWMRKTTHWSPWRRWGCPDYSHLRGRGGGADSSGGLGTTPHVLCVRSPSFPCRTLVRWCGMSKGMNCSAKRSLVKEFILRSGASFVCIQEYKLVVVDRGVISQICGLNFAGFESSTCGV